MGPTDNLPKPKTLSHRVSIKNDNSEKEREKRPKVNYPVKYSKPSLVSIFALSSQC